MAVHGTPRLAPRSALLLIARITTVSALRVSLVRHGETEWNRKGLLQGSGDSPLTENGVRGASACGERLRQRRFDAAYTSPLPRAYRTAELILAKSDHQTALREDSRLRERSFGRWEGLSWSDIKSKFPVERDLAEADGRYRIKGGGESRQETLERAVDFLQSLTMTHGAGDNVLVVTHSATAGCLVKEVLGLRQEQRRNFQVLNCALNEFVWDAKAKAWMLCSLGDCAHLEQLKAPPGFATPTPPV